MKEQDTIRITKDDALSLFCFSGYKPSSLILDNLELLDSENHDRVMYELRTMVLIVNILLNYKSEEVREFIHLLCGRFINDIYKKGTETLSIKDLQFLIPIILKYRNLTNINQIAKVECDKSFYETVRQNLLKLNVIDSYQQLLF